MALASEYVLPPERRAAEVDRSIGIVPILLSALMPYEMHVRIGLAIEGARERLRQAQDIPAFQDDFTIERTNAARSLARVHGHVGVERIPLSRLLDALRCVEKHRADGNAVYIVAIFAFHRFDKEILVGVRKNFCGLELLPVFVTSTGGYAPAPSPSKSSNVYTVWLKNSAEPVI